MSSSTPQAGIWTIQKSGLLTDMRKKCKRLRIVMIGPDRLGQGGISRVVSIWHDEGFLADYDLEYISTTRELSRYKTVSMMRGLLRLLLMVGPADLVYIHSAAYTSFYRKGIFLLLAVLFGKKIILHIHPSEFTDFYECLSGFPRRYASYVLRKVNLFVVLSEEAKRKIQALFPDRTVHLLRNGISLREMREPDGVQRKDGELLYLGWYIREKGVYELVDAVELLKKEGIKVHLNFFGTGGADNLRRYVERKALADLVRVNDWIGPEYKLRVLYSSSMLILPSHSEGIPNVILEAMATRTPIVATSVGGIKEILRDEENALIAKVNNPVDLSEKIARLLQDKELAARLADHAYREARENYDVSVIRRHFLKIIESAGRGNEI